MSQLNSSALRQAILDSLPRDAFAVHGPDPRFLYLPDSHVRALDPDSMLVVGARGTGKSFWWNALQNSSTREIVSKIFPSHAHETLEVVSGWGDGSQPGKDVLKTLLSTDPRIVWKAIVLDRLAPGFFSGTRWNERVAQVQGDPEAVEQRLAEMDAQLSKAGTRKLLLFDALDRVADTWKDRNTLLRGLFELLLDFRYTRSIRLKAFVRADVVDEPSVRQFPDASKLLHARVELTWSKIDLYGLFWQHLGNARAELGKEARGLFKGWTGDEHRWDLPRKLATDEEAQRDLFVRLAGEKMGGGIKRGRPYSWVANHLADAWGKTTPRSFLVALRTAAEKTADDCELTLDWRAIQKGVVHASKIRVEEINEDFAWMEEVMEPLKGMTVPCEQKEVLQRWKRAEVLAKIEKTDQPQKFPPHFEDGHPGLLRDLEQMGVLQQRGENRINIPDLYRVHFGLKRRGGVPPAR